ncbi:hypothetical protein [Streptomyces sp. NPDC050264]|uniref:hypothetical protein n=1 Tax=Streptomyces sp. NPDC050264 TaxID=3155038 RepID=UPI003432E3AB
MRRPALLRSAVVTAALGGAVLAPTAAFADAQAHHAPAHTSAQAPDDGAGDARANPYFLVAGGAMAAAGAAGLVYSTARRGRADT